MRSIQVVLEACLDELVQIRHIAQNSKKYDYPMSRKEAAEYLKIHPDTLYKWAVEEGRIAYHRLGDGARASLRFLRKDLDDFLASQRIPTVEEVRFKRAS